MAFRTIDDIKTANRVRGGHFFSRDTMRFFASRVCEDMFPCADGSAFFITSEKRCFDDPRRAYTIRRACPNGDVLTHDKFGKFKTKATALKYAETAALEYDKATRAGVDA